MALKRGGGGPGGDRQDRSQGGKKQNTFKEPLPERKSHQVTSHGRETQEKRLTSRAISRISEPIAPLQTKTTTLLPSLDPVQDSAGRPRALPEEALIQTLLLLL